MKKSSHSVSDDCAFFFREAVSAVRSTHNHTHSCNFNYISSFHTESADNSRTRKKENKKPKNNKPATLTRNEIQLRTKLTKKRARRRHNGLNFTLKYLTFALAPNTHISRSNRTVLYMFHCLSGSTTVTRDVPPEMVVKRSAVWYYAHVTDGVCMHRRALSTYGRISAISSPQLGLTQAAHIGGGKHTSAHMMKFQVWCFERRTGENCPAAPTWSTGKTSR